MEISEIKRRIAVLESKKPIVVNKRMLRGGMDCRNKRKEIVRYNESIKNKKSDYMIKLEAAQPQEEKLFGVSEFTVSSGVMEIEEKFNEPKLNKTRLAGKGWW